MSCEYSAKCMMYHDRDIKCSTCPNECRIFRDAETFSILTPKDRKDFISERRLDLYFNIIDGQLESKSIMF